MTLTRHLRRKWDRDGSASRDVARRAFVEVYGSAAAAVRQRQIAALPPVEWKGRRLYTVRCSGDFGKGPHTMNVPEAVLWQLIDIGHFLCPYHR